MKKILFSLISITLLFVSCKKETSGDQIEDNITFTEINKTIILSKSDSIEGTCKKIIFEIKDVNSAEYTAILKVNDQLICCDGYNNIFANTENGNAITLDLNQKISENLNWVDINDICLDDFAGKGEKYIGYRSVSYGTGIPNYNYGWIKIELSADKKTLKIISRATNYEESKDIITGQIR